MSAPAIRRAAYDVVVAGGGPAGLAAAAAAAAAGAETLLVEAQPSFGRPVRTSGGSWPPDLERFGLGEGVWHPVAAGELWSAGRTVRCRPTRALGCVLDVPAAWGELAARARRAGATLWPASAARWGGLAPGSALVELSGGPHPLVHARVVVDASGHRASLLRAAGLAPPLARRGIGVEETWEAAGWPDDTIVLAMGGVAPTGYAWLFPEGGGRVRVGVGVTRPGPAASARALLRGWLEREPRLASVRAGRLLERRAGTIPLDPHRPPPVGDRLVGCGDAAGQLSLLTGEGIRYALAAGEAAGRAGAAAAADGETSARSLRVRYSQAWWDAEGRLLERGDRAYEWMARLGDGHWDRVLDRLARLDADDVARLLHGDLSLPLLARLAPRTLRRRLGAGVSLA